MSISEKLEVYQHRKGIKMFRNARNHDNIKQSKEISFELHFKRDNIKLPTEIDINSSNY